MSSFIIRDARPPDATFLAKCILAGFHFANFDDLLSDDLSDFLDQLTECEGREDTLYTYSRTRIAEVDGKPAGALLSYPGELYKGLRTRTFKEYWPAAFAQSDYSLKNSFEATQTEQQQEEMQEYWQQFLIG